MSPQGGGAQPGAYVPSANRASCPAEVSMVRAAGGGRRALQPPALPAVPEWRSGAAGPGKRRRPGKASPRAGGRREGGPSAAAARLPRLALTPRPGGGNGKRPPAPLCHSGPGTADPSPAPLGVPPSGQRGWRFGAGGGDTARCVQGAGGGAGRSGTP